MTTQRVTVSADDGTEKELAFEVWSQSETIADMFLGQSSPPSSPLFVP